jgi:hypothetical protein
MKSTVWPAALTLNSSMISPGGSMTAFVTQAPSTGLSDGGSIAKRYGRLHVTVTAPPQFEQVAVSLTRTECLIARPRGECPIGIKIWPGRIELPN